MDDLLTPCISSLTPMDLLLHLLLILPFVALDDACTTVGGPAVNQVLVVVNIVVVIFIVLTTVPIIFAKVVILKYQACVLPFSFGGRLRTGCINDEDPQGRYWCRLVINSFNISRAIILTVGYFQHKD